MMKLTDATVDKRYRIHLLPFNQNITKIVIMDPLPITMFQNAFLGLHQIMEEDGYIGQILCPIREAGGIPMNGGGER